MLKYSRLSSRQMRAWELYISRERGEGRQEGRRQCHGIISILFARTNAFHPLRSARRRADLRIRTYVMIISALLRVCPVRYFPKGATVSQRQMALAAIRLHYFDVARITVVVRAQSNEMHFFVRASRPDTYSLSYWPRFTCHPRENENRRHS